MEDISAVKVGNTYFLWNIFIAPQAGNAHHKLPTGYGSSFSSKKTKTRFFRAFGFLQISRFLT